jgi:DNA-directed RNA polymerase subunit RPC12/RpoP
MAARTTRQEARGRIIKSFMDSLDKIIPPEESVPLRGQTFLEWEQQADTLRKAVVPTLLQERAALDPGAEVDASNYGNCPRCGSNRIYLDRPDEKAQKEVISPHGPVVILKQHCRCRACGRSFSPSGA